MGTRKSMYPANLLSALSLSQNMEYEKLTADQLEGLQYVLSGLTERNQILIQEYYGDCKSLKEIALRYHLTENRVRQCIAQALRILNHSHEKLLYIANGYHANVRYLTECLEKSESLYKRKVGIDNEQSIFYQNIERLSLPTRINTALKKSGVQTVRDLLIWVCAGFRIRNLGATSRTQIIERLSEENLLPETFVPDDLPDMLPRLNVEVEVFRRLNVLII